MTIYFQNSRLLFRTIRALGDKTSARNKMYGRLFIITFHRILEAHDPLLDSEPDIESFRWQMELLANCFNVMPLHDAIDSLAQRDVPPRTVCITFDDGYRSVHDLALPILEQYKLPATVFVATGFMDNSNMWNDRIVESIRRLDLEQLDMREVGLGMYPVANLAERKNTLHQIMEEIKYFPPPSREKAVHWLEKLAGLAPSQGLMLTREMIGALSRRGVEIGAHTISHPILTRLEDEIAFREICGSKCQLEGVTGKPVRFFAYPNGKLGRDFDERHVRMVKEAGFDAAFTTALGSATTSHNRFQIPRGRPWDRTPALYGMRLLHWLTKKTA